MVQTVIAGDTSFSWTEFQPGENDKLPNDALERSLSQFTSVFESGQRLCVLLVRNRGGGMIKIQADGCPVRIEAGSGILFYRQEGDEHLSFDVIVPM